MNKEKIKRFAELITRQVETGVGDVNDILSIEASLNEDGYCYYNLYQEWKGAFSYVPGQQLALAPLQRLTKKLINAKSNETFQMYNTSEWKELVDLRGPFECAIEYECRQCHHLFTRFGQSGFDDRYPSVCTGCGNVWMQSGYDKTPLPKCDCGGEYCSSGCPECHSDEYSSQRYFSSYEYFHNHKWKEKK